MVVVAQLVRVLVCGAEGRRFEPGQPPRTQKPRRNSRLFLWQKKLKKYFFIIYLRAITTFRLYQLQVDCLYLLIPMLLKKPIEFFFSKLQIQFYQLHRWLYDNQHVLR